jgi:hypothetical protein
MDSMQTEREQGLGSHNPFQGQTSRSLKTSTKPHLLKFQQHNGLEVKPSTHGPWEPLKI